MSSTTKTTKASPWWYCGKCGFKNKPHQNHAADAPCEQCGADPLDPDAQHTPYSPAGGSSS